LGPAMINYILIGKYKCANSKLRLIKHTVAEPSGSAVTGSLHKTARRTFPPPLNDPNIKLTTIASQTTASQGSWKYTFLCSGCLAAGSANFTQDAAAGAIAWAYVSARVEL